jgi:hypothetical protein
VVTNLLNVLILFIVVFFVILLVLVLFLLFIGILFFFLLITICFHYIVVGACTVPLASRTPAIITVILAITRGFLIRRESVLVLVATARAVVTRLAPRLLTRIVFIVRQVSRGRVEVLPIAVGVIAKVEVEIGGHDGGKRRTMRFKSRGMLTRRSGKAVAPRFGKRYLCHTSRLV